MKFVRRPKPAIEAFQFLSVKVAVPPGVKVDDRGPHVVQADGTRVDLEPGDWVVLDSDLQNHYVMKDKVLQANYEVCRE
jgi:hypothetical protein